MTTKWEYGEVFKGTSGNWNFFSSANASVKSQGNRMAVLAELGEQGWEAYHVHVTNDVELPRIYLKRQAS